MPIVPASRLPCQSRPVRAIAGLVLAAALLAVGTGDHAMAETEQARYAVEASSGDFEIRRYEPLVVAEVAVPGGRDEAVNAGFRILAGYIFGGNEPGQSIPMTAPVTQVQTTGSGGESIAMTAPVTQQGDGSAWTVRFGMPAGSTMTTLPRPKDRRIALKTVPERRMAAVRFSGFRTDARLAVETERLSGFLRERGLKPAGQPTFAYYDPPWTLPFLRRNEVLWEVK